MLFPVWLFDHCTVQPAQTFAAFNVVDSPGQSSVSPFALIVGVVGAASTVTGILFEAGPAPQGFASVAV